MPNRSSKRKTTDPNVAAFRVMQHVIAMSEGKEPPASDQPPAKNPAAVELGRLGGLKGGRARAEKLSPRKRREIARKASKARWAKRTATQ